MSEARWDVLVAGGGLAGVAAAVSAARLGARTLLVERDSCLGGNATSALVHTICGLHLPARGDAAPEPANPGFPLRLSQRLAAEGGAGPPERAGGSFVLPTRPPVLERVLLAIVEATAGLDLALEAPLATATLSRDPRAAHRVTLRTKQGPRELSATIALDATGDATLAALGGADLLCAAAGELQHPSFIFRVSGVDGESAEGFARLRVTADLAHAARRGALPAGCDSVLLRPGAEGELYLTVTLPKPDAARFDPLDAVQLAALDAMGRRAAKAIVARLAARPGWEHARISGWPRRPGIRETRRVHGRVVIEADDLRGGRLREDEVARSAWPLELWESPTRPRFEPVKGASSVPLGALVSRSHAGLGMAGRCLSASHEALGSLRVLGTAMATGEAAGAAAALAAREGISLDRVAPSAVRTAIARLAAEDLPWRR